MSTPQDGYSQTLGNLSLLMLESIRKAALPTRQLQPFSGDPLEYGSFIQAFMFTIENKTDSEVDRLYFLEQFTIGEANRLVRSCMSAPNGYKEARRLLDRKCGNKHRIVEAYMRRITEVPEIKGNDATGLHKFAVLLVECHNNIAGLGYEQELNNTASMKLIVSKLP